jgi:hypothetical protein
MIPRVIHQIWVGGVVPERFEEGMRSWVEHHPAWTHQLWTDATDWRWLYNYALYRSAADLVPPDAVGQFKADLIRYELLYTFGGLYADIDTVCLRPMDDQLDGHDNWAAAEDDHWVGNTYLGAERGSQLMAALVSLIGPNLAHYKRQGRQLKYRPNRLSGPRYLTPIWNSWGAHVADGKLFYPYSYSHVKRGSVPKDVPPETYAIHQWDHTQRCLKGRK